MRYREIIEAVSPHVGGDNFRRWFHGSKVVDSSGKPLVVFHGTFEDFREFKLDSEKRRANGMNRLGFWFDVGTDTPNWFATGGLDSTGGKVLLAYLSIKRPFVFTSEPVFRDDEDTLARHSGDEQWGKFNKHVEMMDRQDSFDHMVRMIGAPSINDSGGPRKREEAVERFRDELIGEGYDGIHLPDTYADAGTRGGRRSDWWIAFRSNQIKAVMGNSGGFDPESPDITL